MVTVETLTARREEVAASPDLRALGERLARNVRPLLERPLYIPATKALLSRDGGVCADDGERLVFDPWQPEVHRCAKCGREYRGERHHRAWVMWYQLWLAERAVHLAVLQALRVLPEGAARACEILTLYGARYPDYPNRDNVLGPGRVFFSTYLESIWLLNLLTAGTVLRESGALTRDAEQALSRLAEESIGYIGDFDERLSNRQVWRDTALLAAADWFEDEDLGLQALEGNTGLLALIHSGMGREGMWYEGENYHFFALRGLLHGVTWARRVGFDLLDERKGGGRLRAAFRTPLLTALPDLSFPARKDSAFGVSLLQPRFAELWELGYAFGGDPEVLKFLHHLYRAPAAARTDDGSSAVADVERNLPAAKVARSDLSWMALLWMTPELPPSEGEWRPASVLLEEHGLALLRTGVGYTSVECGRMSGGHDHPDRLHLTLHAAGEPWLLDLGTGSYVQEDLFWYRSTRVHNAPVIDGQSQRPADAHCLAFDVKGEWAWARCRIEGNTAYADVAATRTVVAGPAYVLDVVEVQASREVLFELPWHFLGEVRISSPGEWVGADFEDRWITGAKAFRPQGRDPIALSVRRDQRRLDAWLLSEGELLQATAPGPPGTGPGPMHLVRARGTNFRVVTLLAPDGVGGPVSGLAARGGGDDLIVQAGGEERHAMTDRGWRISTPSGPVELAGVRQIRPGIQSVADLDFLSRPEPVRGLATAVDEPPALDGSLDGFDTSEPLVLDDMQQYRRGDEWYPGPDQFAATAYLSWDGDGLYVAVEVRKSDVAIRPAGAPPLLLDNEPDDIHSDGVQVYLDLGTGQETDPARVFGFLVVPELAGRTVRVRPVSGTAAAAGMATGGWRKTATGYAITMKLAVPGWKGIASGGTRVGFDLLVNEMHPGRERRAGQLVWSGRNGWVWLQGDRQHPSRFGEVELCP